MTAVSFDLNTRKLFVGILHVATGREGVRLEDLTTDRAELKILQLTLRALLTPQEQWRLARTVEEGAHEAQWFPKYLWWALWHTEPPMPPVAVVNLGGELEQQPEEEQQEERHGWTLNNGGLPTFVEMRHPRPTTMRRRRDRQSLSWHTDPPS